MQKTEYPALLTRRLDRLKDEWKSISSDIIIKCRDIYPEGTDLADAFARFLEAPGKFIRPSMFLFGYELKGTEPSAEIIRLALSFELLHTYLLIHDDIMDASDFRRGVPSVHRLAEEYHRTHALRGDAAYFGISVAVLFGDIIATRAIELWSEALTAGVATPAARAVFDEMHRDVCWGQYVDLMAPTQKKIPSREIITMIMKEKTSKYTMTAPLMTGAVMAEVPLDWIGDFGTALGIAYQVADDILGVYGDTAVTGKSNDSDIREGKATYLLWAALEAATPEDREIITHFYTGNERNEYAAAEVKSLFDRYNVRKKAEDIAVEYMKQALTVIDGAPIDSSAKELLSTLAHFVVERNK